MNPQNLVSVSQLAEETPSLTEAMLRWWIFNAHTNGFHRCLIKVGGRVFIDRVAFGHWLEEHRL